MTLPQDLILIIASYIAKRETLAQLCQVNPFFVKIAQDNEFWLKLLQREFGQRYDLDLRLHSEWEPLCRNAQVYFQLSIPCPLRRTDIDDQGRLWHLICELEFDDYYSRVPESNVKWHNFPRNNQDIVWSEETPLSLRTDWSFLHGESRNGYRWLVFQCPKDITVVQHHHVPFDEDPGMERNHLVYLRNGNLELFSINVLPEGQVILKVSCLLTGVIEWFHYAYFDSPHVELFEEVYMETLACEDMYFYLFHTEDGFIHYRVAPFVSYNPYESKALTKVAPEEEVHIEEEYSEDCVLRVDITPTEFSVVQHFGCNDEEEDDDEDDEEIVPRPPCVLYHSERV